MARSSKVRHSHARHTHTESPFHLVGTFPGPEGSPYEKGIFDIDIQIPDGYPFKPLVMKFITKVYHPNISSASGWICLDILKDAWSPVSIIAWQRNEGPSSGRC